MSKSRMSGLLTNIHIISFNNYEVQHVAEINETPVTLNTIV